MSLALVLAACGDRAPASGAETGGTIIIAAPSRGNAPLFPAYAADPVSRIVTDNVYERLAEIGEDVRTIGDRGFTPLLARGWKWARDSMSIAFVLDPRAKWHDGRPVRASDVKFSFDLYKNPKTGSTLASLLGDIDSVSVRDSTTAVVWYKRRSPEQFYSFVYQVPIVPEHVLKDIAPEALMTSAAMSAPVGSGRFRIGRVEPGVRIELVADTAHYRARARLDRVIISLVGDVSIALTQVLAGQADFIEIVPPDALGRVDSAATTKLVPYPGLQYVYLGMNFRDKATGRSPHPIFSDVRVRRAVSLAIDRDAMLRNVYGTRGFIGKGPFPAKLGDTTIRLPAFDRAHAAALLDSAGWRAGADGMRSKGGRPLAFSLMVPTSSAARVRYGVLVQEALKQVGIRVDIDQRDFRAFYTTSEAGKYDAALHGAAADPSPRDLRQSWTRAAFPPEGQNWVRYSNPVVDALADSIIATSDTARLAQLRRRAYQAIIDDAPGVWLYDVLTIAGAHNRVRPEGVRVDLWWAGLGDWWIPANERIDRDQIGLRAPSQP